MREELVKNDAARNERQSQDGVSIREISVEDAAAVARLTGQLGYPVTVEAMQQRIATLINLRDHVVYAACMGDSVVGWIDVRIAHHLQSEPCGEIGGLVVDRQFRSRGIGALLVATGERWVAEQTIAKIRVRSRIEREAAHRFYLRLNYSRTKTSAVFVKTL